MRRVGKATGSRECAPDGRLRVPTIYPRRLKNWWARFALPTLRFWIASLALAMSGDNNSLHVVPANAGTHNLRRM